MKFDWERGIGILENDVTNKSVPKPPKVERRKAPRISYSVPVKVRVKDKKEDWKAGATVDVSRYGIRVSIALQKVTIGTHIDIEVKLPQATEPCQMEGVVVWIKPGQKGKTVECGVSFEDFKKSTRVKRVIDFLADKLCTFAIKRSEKLNAYPIQSEEHLRKAFSLAYKEYALKGYCDEHPSKLYYSYFSLLPDSQTFLLENKKQLLGTISLIPDSKCGLPLETIFKDEVAAIRKPGRRLAEVSLLALNMDVFKRKFALTDLEKMSAAFKLFKMLFDYARFVLGITDFLITMHPKHQGLYEFLRFEPIGRERQYGSVLNKPAIPMHMGIEAASGSTPKNSGLWNYYLKVSTPIDVLVKRYKWQQKDAIYYLKSERKIWDKIPEDHKQAIAKYYPDLLK